MENVIVINYEIDLVFSEDDNGYYFQQFKGKTDRVSKIYPTKDQALQAYKNNKIIWEKWN